MREYHYWNSYRLNYSLRSSGDNFCVRHPAHWYGTYMVSTCLIPTTVCSRRLLYKPAFWCSIRYNVEKRHQIFMWLFPEILAIAQYVDYCLVLIHRRICHLWVFPQLILNIMLDTKKLLHEWLIEMLTFYPNSSIINW